MDYSAVTIWLLIAAIFIIGLVMVFHPGSVSGYPFRWDEPQWDQDGPDCDEDK